MKDERIETSEADPEPENHAMFTLTISGLDYLRLSCHLRQQAELHEELAKQFRDGQGDVHGVFASSHEAEARHFERIHQGLSSGWKPGRSPIDVGRWKERETALRSQGERHDNR